MDVGDSTCKLYQSVCLAVAMVVMLLVVRSRVVMVVVVAEPGLS